MHFFRFHSLSVRAPIFHCILILTGTALFESASKTQESEPTPLSVIAQQGPNLASWVLAPLDQSIPNTIRQKVTFLREDLIDEGKTKPASSLDTYRIAHQFCNSLISALDERDQMLLKAGFQSVQAGTTTPASNSALEARRNYMMSWPQFSREVEQRNDLLRVVEAGDRRRVELALQALKIQWASRAATMRTHFDSVYVKFREELRDSGLTVKSFTGGGQPPSGTAANAITIPSGAVPSTSGTQFTNTLGMKFVPVSGTSVMFCIHETRRKDYAIYYSEVSGADGFWKNVRKSGVPCGHEDDHPVVGVSWHHAKAFCEWLSKKEGKHYRIPTDQEWSAAVGIDNLERQGANPESLNQLESTWFPWGKKYPPKTSDLCGNYADETYHATFPNEPYIQGYNDGYATTSPVMSFKPNKFGIYDMGGNVHEWVEDLWPSEPSHRVLRDACFNSQDRSTLLSSNRHHFLDARTGVSSWRHGFRVVLAPAAQSATSTPPTRPSSSEQIAKPGTSK